jgi:Flp pilus assembly protein TadG
MTSADCAKLHSRMFPSGAHLRHKSPTTALRGLLSSHGLVSKFRTNPDGSSAVEFAIIAAPFLAILLGALELALIFIVNIGLNVATETLATRIRTGQVQAPGLAVTSSSGVQLDLADAKTALCNQIQIVSSATCMQQLQIDVRPLTSFQQTSSASPIAGNTFNSSNLCYYSGNAGDVVQMRAYYLYPLIDPLLSYAFSVINNYINSSGSSSGNYYPIQTTQVFKSESYSGLSNSGAGC